MVGESRLCGRCGVALPTAARICGRCGTIASPRAPAGFDASVSTFLDTIRIPGATATETAGGRVRPALAVLYRVAIGPGADYYAPRFLKYEQAGRGAPGWNWPSFLFPSFWAFYRKLWLEGLLFALLPVAGALLFAGLGPRLDETHIPWLAAAIALMWLLPGIIPALFANSLLYRRVRRRVARAESRTGSMEKVIRLLAFRRPTSLIAASLLSAGAIALGVLLAGPTVRAAYAEHDVRTKLAAGLEALRPLQEQIEDRWNTFRTMPGRIDYDSLSLHAAAALFDDVVFRPATGRLRLGLGPSIPELWGRSILLAPVLDVGQRIRWVCVPVDIPARFLPKDCAGG
jgi:hypothetical protein